MKLIIAIIQPSKLEEVKEELYRKEVNLITVSEVMGTAVRKALRRFIVAQKRQVIS